MEELKKPLCVLLQETYDYFSIPHCGPDTGLVHKASGLGVAIEGSDLRDSGLRVRFGQDSPTGIKICDLVRAFFVVVVVVVVLVVVFFFAPFLRCSFFSFFFLGGLRREQPYIHAHIMLRRWWACARRRGGGFGGVQVLDADKVGKLSEVVKEHYWYQLYVDELPMWGMVGEYMSAEAPQETAHALGIGTE
jgi:hypothetical protein